MGLTCVVVMCVCVSPWVCRGSEGGPMGRPPQRGGPKHRGVFYSQSDTNKTIPHSSKPGKELLIFDMDGTLWPYWIDIDPRFYNPFVIKGSENGTAEANGYQVHVFPEVTSTLTELTDKGYVLAAVSLTNSSAQTMALLSAFDLVKHFKHLEVAPGPDKLSLIKEVSKRADIPLEDILYFEKDPREVVDMLWNHVIVYCVDKDGLTKERARKGLKVFDIRPRKERRRLGPHKTEQKEKSNKNKSRPAYERDGTELEGMLNFTAIEYS